MVKHISTPLFTEEELAALAGPPPLDAPGFQETSALRWMTWRFIREAEHLDKNWVKLQLKTTILGYHHASLKVVGVTRRALAEFAGPSGAFPADASRRRGTFQRAHLYPRRKCVQELLQTPIEELTRGLGEEGFVRWIWNRDVTVLCLKEENNSLEDRDFFVEHAITFPNPGGALFRDLGSMFAYGAREREVLRTLWEGENAKCTSVTGNHQTVI